MPRLLSVVILLSACSEPPPRAPEEDVDTAGTTGEVVGDDSSSGEPVPAGSSSGEPDDEGSGDGSSSGGEGEPIEGPIDGRDCPPDNGLTADNFGMPFLFTWCAGCHHSDLLGESRAGAPTGVDFDTLTDVEPFVQRIYARAADEHDEMPPAGGPTAGDRMLLGDWLACGAPE